MNQDLFFLASQVLRFRRKAILLCLLIVTPLIIVAVRAKEVPFTATIKLFVAPPNSSSLGGKLGMAGLGAMSVLDRDTIISGQETLAGSRLVYAKVRSLMASSGAISPPNEPPAWRVYLDPVTRLMFGDSYVMQRRAYIDWEYLKFKEKVIFQPNLEAGSFSLSYSDTDPGNALRVAGYLATALIEVNREILRDRSTDSLKVLTDKIAETRGELDASSKRIVDFVKSRSFPNSDKYLELSYESYVKAADRELELRTQIKGLEALVSEYREVEKVLGAALEESIGGGKVAAVEALAAELGQYEVAHARIAADDSATAKRLQDQIVDLRQKIQAATKTLAADELLGAQALRELYSQVEFSERKALADLAAVKATEVSHRSVVEKVKTDLDRFPELQAELSQLTVSHAQLGQVLALVTEQYYQTLIGQDFQGANIHVVEDPAIAPGSISSKKSVVLLAGLAFATMIVVVLFAFREGLRGTIFSVTQLERVSPGTPALVMPHLTVKEIGNLVSTSFVHEEIIDFGERLKRHLRKIQSASGAKVVLTTGATPEVGKSVTAYVGALCLHRKGHRVAVLDADFRAQRRNLKDLANSQEAKVVRDRAELGREIEQYERSDTTRPFLARLDIAAGTDPGARDFEGKAQSLIEALRSRFDVVIVDGAPTFFSDTLTLADHADVILVCVRQNRSRIAEQVEAAAAIAAHRGEAAQVITVLTDVVTGPGSGMLSSYRREHYGSSRRVA